MKDLLRLARLIAPFWKWLSLGALCALATVLANVGLLALSSWFIVSMAVAGATTGFMDYVTPSAGVRAFALLRSGGRYLERLLTHEATFRILSRMRGWLCGRIEPLAPAGTQDRRAGDLLSRMGADVDTLSDFYLRGLVPLVVAAFSMTAVFLFLLRYSAGLAAVGVASLAAAGLLLPLGVGSLARGPGERAVRAAAELRAATIDEVQGMAEIVMAGVAEQHREHLQALSRQLVAHQRALSAVAGLSGAALVLLSSGAMWAGAVIAIPLIAARRLPPVDVAMLAILMLASFEAVAPLPAAFERLGQIRTAARRVFSVADAAPRTAIRPAEAAAAGAGARAAMTPPALSFESVRFRYHPDRAPALDGVSFSVQPGERVGIVGSSGAGKSSVVNLLARFWEQQEGTIRIAGRDLRSFEAEEARSLFAVASQNPYLFHATIRENLLLAAPEATDDEIRRALVVAQLADVLPCGLETPVGQTGLKMSAGQVRRIEIARAILKHAPMLVLDEPTEGLDATTGRAMMEAVYDASAGGVLLVITHHLAALGQVDRVLVFEQGRIVEQGTPAGLMRAGVLYRQLMELDA